MAGAEAAEQQHATLGQVGGVETAGGPQAVFVLGGQAQHMVL
ncbi:hypothetical protein ABHF91_09960 [Pseudaeromonas sp. ZJS20]